MSQQESTEDDDDRREEGESAAGETREHPGPRAAGQSWAAGSAAGPAAQPSGPSGSAAPPEASEGGLGGRTWWQRFPERYEYELRALDTADIRWNRDEEAFAAGLLRLNLQVDMHGKRLPLRVTFPDLYPYFRFEVEAPTLSLPHHQNPFQKNLCLMGRSSFYWHTSDTVAGVLGEQLAKVVSTGNAEEAEPTRGLEQEQAEPFSDYYPCAASMVVLHGNMPLSETHHRGTFRVVTAGPPGRPSQHRFMRGVLATLWGAEREVLFEASPQLTQAYSGSDIEGFWARLSAPIPHADQSFLEELLRRVPHARTARINRVSDGYLQVWGVAFPEESLWRGSDGLGWVFICLFNQSRDKMVHSVAPRPTSKGHSNRRSKGKKSKGNRKSSGRR